MMVLPFFFPKHNLNHRAQASKERNESLENLLVVFIEKENILSSSLKDFHLG